jgi:hypothetical protein
LFSVRVVSRLNRISYSQSARLRNEIAVRQSSMLSRSTNRALVLGAGFESKSFSPRA